MGTNCSEPKKMDVMGWHGKLHNAKPCTVALGYLIKENEI
jgi:hypothetical protein